MIIFLFCFLYLVFDTYIMWFLHSNKRWLSERFSLLSRYELFFIEHFLFCLNVFVFIWLPIFVLILIILIMIIFVIIVFVIVITIIISSFSMLVISLVFTILFYLCIYRIFLNFKQMTCDRILLKVGSKDTETVSVSLMGTLNTVCLTYSSENLLLKWRYFILLLTIISFIL